MFRSGELPEAIIESKGLQQSNDSGEIEALCQEAIAGNAKAVAQYKEGNTKALNALKACDESYEGQGQSCGARRDSSKIN